MATATRNPTSDEAVSGTWSGSAGSRYASVNDHPDATGSSKLTHGTTAGNLTFGFSAFAIPAAATSISVEVSYYDEKTGGGSAASAARLKVGGNYYNASTHNPSNGSWVLRTDTWANNPKTGVGWTVVDINGVGANALQAFGFFSDDANPTVEYASVIITVSYDATLQGSATIPASATMSGDGKMAAAGAASISASGLLTALATVMVAAAATISAGASVTADGDITAPSANYAHKREIIIDHNQFTGTHSDFPFLISGTYPYLKHVSNGGDVEHSSGYDVAFYADEALTTQLAHEVEKWDGSTGDTIAWVKIPSLSHTVDTSIWIAYGDSGISSSQEDAAGVWSADYNRVYHLSDNAASTDVIDATSTQNAISVANTNTNAAVGKIGGALSFNGSTDKLTIASVPLPTGTGNYTVSAWVKTSSTGTRRGIAEWGQQITNNDGGTFQKTNAEKLASDNTNIAGPVSTNTISNGAWRYVCVVHTSGSTQLYIDGSADGSPVSMSPNIATGDKNMIGCNYYGGVFRDFWLGDIDEVRFSGINRSGTWIADEFTQQYNPSSTYAIQNEAATLQGAAVINAIADVIADAKMDVSGAATFGAQADVSASASVSVSASAAFDMAQATMSASATVVVSASASIAASAGISATSKETISASASAGASAGISATSIETISASASFGASAAVVADGKMSVPAEASISCGADIIANGTLGDDNSATINCGATVSASATVQVSASASISASASVVADGKMSVPATVAFDAAQANVIANGTLNDDTSAVITCGATVSASATVQVSASAAFDTAQASVLASATAEVSVSAAIAAGADLSATSKETVSASASLDAQAGITATATLSGDTTEAAAVIGCGATMSASALVLWHNHLVVMSGGKMNRSANFKSSLKGFITFKTSLSKGRINI